MRKFKSILFFILFIPICAILTAQESADRLAITSTIYQLFDGMRTGDSSMVRQAFLKNASMKSMYNSKDGKLQLKNGSQDKFVLAVGTQNGQYWDERIDNLKIDIDGPMAAAWMNYAFYLNGEFSHCGVNQMILASVNNSWKITAITDTRRKGDCVESEQGRELILKEINKDIWSPFVEHYNSYDYDAFNGLHTDDMIRITDGGISNGIAYKKRNEKNFMQNKSEGTIRSIHFYFLQRHVSKDMGYDIGYYKVEVTKLNAKKPDMYYGQFHVTSKKMNGRWFIVQDQDMSKINGVEVDENWLEGLEEFKG